MKKMAIALALAITTTLFGSVSFGDNDYTILFSTTAIGSNRVSEASYLNGNDYAHSKSKALIAAREWIVANSNQLQIKCEKVRLSKAIQTPHYDPISTRRYVDVWLSSSTISVECKPRKLQEMAYVSLAINCALNPTEDCFKAMQVPATAEALKRIQNTAFDVD